MKNQKNLFLIALVFLGISSSVFSEYDLSRMWELEVTDLFNAADPEAAVKRFRDEFKSIGNYEERIQVLRTFQRILAERSEHYPTDSLPDGDVRSRLLNYKQHFGALELGDEYCEEELDRHLDELHQSIGLDPEADAIPWDAAMRHLEAFDVTPILLDLRFSRYHWRAEAERSLRLDDPFEAYAAVVRGVERGEPADEKLAVIKDAADYFVESNQGEFILILFVESLNLLDFEFDENGRVTNAADLRRLILHEIAMEEGDVSFDEIKDDPLAIQTLRIIEAVSGEADPLLSEARKEGKL